MTNPMRHNLKKGLAKKGVIESTERFVKLIYPLLESEAWRWLKPNSQAVYIELRRRFNGSNNGKISFSLAEGARILMASKSTIQKALVELEEHGFIQLVQKGRFRGRRASGRAGRRTVGWLPTDKDGDNGEPAGSSTSANSCHRYRDNTERHAK